MSIKFSYKSFIGLDGSTVTKEYFEFSNNGKEVEGLVDDSVRKEFADEYELFKNPPEVKEPEAEPKAKPKAKAKAKAKRKSLFKRKTK